MVAAAVAVGAYVWPAPAPVTPGVALAPRQVVRPQVSVAAKPTVRASRSESAAPAAAGILPAAYRVLLTRSIFCPHPKGAAGLKSPDAALALRGIVQWERGYYAYVENTTSGEARQVYVGDTIGRKKVINIDFHSVEFVEGKRAMRIAVGQTFDPLSSAANGSALATVRPQAD